MNEELNNLKREVEELKAFKRSLESSHSIPLSVDQAIRKRFLGTELKVSTVKTANDEDQAVNEAGAASYSVMGDPDGFLEITINAVPYYLPYFL